MKICRSFILVVLALTVKSVPPEDAYTQLINVNR